MCNDIPKCDYQLWIKNAYNISLLRQAEFGVTVLVLIVYGNYSNSGIDKKKSKWKCYGIHVQI